MQRKLVSILLLLMVTSLWLFQPLVASAANNNVQIHQMTHTSSLHPMAVSGPQTYGIGFVNTDTGEINYWTTSSYAQWSQRLQQEQRLRGFPLSSKVVSPNIVRVNGCSSGRNQYYDLRNIPAGGNVPVCFAQSGDTGRINVYCVYEVWSGNNTGWFKWTNRVGFTGTDQTPWKNYAYIAAGDGTGGCPSNTFSDIIEVNIN